MFTIKQLGQMARKALIECIRRLLKRVRQLEQRVKELERRLAQKAQNSSNSHRPPSSNGLPNRPRPKSLRTRSGRQSGGQPGHRGQTLERAQKPDHIQIHKLSVCPQCGGGGLDREAVQDYESRQVFDLPPQPLEVTEHRAEIKDCPHCGDTVRAEFPTGVNAPVQYGSRFQALLVYLNQQQMLPYDRLAQLCQDLFGQPLSAGTLVAAVERVFAQLEPFARALVQRMPQAPLVHLDESGLRVAGVLHWLHVASTGKLTFYGVHRKRGKEAMEALGIVGKCRQWVMHDFWKPYFSFSECLHALCNEHLLRELKFLWEEQGERWAKPLSDLLLVLHRRRQKQGPFSERQYRWAEKHFKKVLRRGRYRHPHPPSGQRRRAQSKAANLLDRLEDFGECYLAFLWDEDVPFTNNQAEQDVRMIKVRQKISGCFRTLHGAEMFCRIRSYLSTCRKQGHNLWEAITRVVVGDPFLPSCPPAGP